MISRIEVTQESQRALRVKLENGRRGTERGLSVGIHKATIWLSSRIKRDYLSGQLVNRRSGNLSRAVFPHMVGPTTGVVSVGAEAPYAKFVNDGTRPHIITAHGYIIGAAGRAGLDVKGLNGPKALRFVMNGKVMFRAYVNNPGIRARHFMETALRDSIVDIRRIITEQVNRGATGKSVE